MSTGALVGLLLVVVATVAWSLAAMGLAKANPDQRIDRGSNERLGRYRAVYITSFALAMLGSFQLKDEYGWWVVFVAFAVFLIPATTITTVHNRRLARRTPAA